MKTATNQVDEVKASEDILDHGIAATAADQTAVLLRADTVSVTYRSSRGPQRAVDRLSLSIREGEFVSIVGPSGCGKSTFLNVAAGLLGASEGSVTVRGKKVVGPRSDIGVIFQKPTLLPWATVRSNILLPIEALRLKKRDYLDKAEQLLDLIGLKDFARHYPEELSGGMQQRVGIARALIHDPKLLLMDEPFAALDAMTRERMSVELQAIRDASKKTVLFITHSIPEAVFLSDRILVMSPSPGRIVHEIAVDLPRPRSMALMASPEFAALCGDIRKTFIELMGPGHE
jgi:NitT/TauT family transport system ATP-binding protein